MRFRWFVVLSALILFSGISSHNLIAQAVVDGLSKAALPQRPGSLTPQEFARVRALPGERGHSPIGQTPSVDAASSGATTPGFGGFVSAPFVSGGLSEVIALVNGDFNHDGKPDVAAVDSGGNIEVFENDGKGSFGTHTATYSHPGTSLNGAQFNSAVATDLNGDGYTDLILGVFRSSSRYNLLVVLLNQKDGTFGTASLVTLTNPDTGGLITSYSFSVAQTTSSGHPDIVAVEPYSSSQTSGQDEILLQTFLNNGSGIFTSQPVQTVPIPNGQNLYGTMLLAFDDVNHDGKLDMLLALNSPVTSTVADIVDSVDILPGNGDGTFQAPNVNSTVAFPLPEGVPTSEFLVQSLRGDASKKDLILTNQLGVFVALSKGDGTFQAPILVPDTAYVTQVNLADLNGDGKLDLIASGSGGLETYLGNGDGTFGGITSTAYAYGETGIGSPDQTVVADFDGDGKLDFANVDYHGDVQTGYGNGDGTFATTPLLYLAGSPVSLPSKFFMEAASDLNGDGVPDLLGLAGPPSYSVVSAVTNATGGFSYHIALAQSAYHQLSYIEPIAADFNGDGKQDVVMAGVDGTVGVALSNGDGTLNPHVAVITLTPTLGCSVGNAAAGDINGDGKMDLVFPYYGDNECGSGTVPSGYITILGNGDGTFKTPVFHAQGAGIATVALGNFHGAGQPLDLVIGDDGYLGSTPNVSLLKGDGKGGFGTPVVVNSGNGNQQVLTDDFNQDGKPDLTLVIPDTGEGGSSLLFAGNGDGTFGAAQNVDGDVITGSAVYTDVNGDGITDLIGFGRFTQLSVNLGVGNGAFAAPIHYFFSSPYSVLFAGRFLGDNTQSIVGLAGFGGTAFFMNQGGTSLVVTPSAASVTAGQSVMLSASLTATLTGQPAPTGTISFFDGTTQIGSEAVGTPLVLASPALGVHSITAKYSGDGHFNPNISTAVTVTVATPPPADFTFTSTGGSLTVAKGGSGTLSLTVAANASLSAAVTFACSGLPSEASCGFSPASLNVAAGTSGSSMLTISTKAASANVRLRADGRSGRFGQSGRSGLAGLSAAAMAGLMCCLLPRGRGRWLVLVVVLGLGAVAGLSGCGGGSKVITPTGPSDPGTPAGTSNVTVTATAVSGSTTVSHTMTVALTVQ